MNVHEVYALSGCALKVEEMKKTLWSGPDTI